MNYLKTCHVTSQQAHIYQPDLVSVCYRQRKLKRQKEERTNNIEGRFLWTGSSLNDSLVLIPHFLFAEISLSSTSGFVKSRGMYRSLKDYSSAL